MATEAVIAAADTIAAARTVWRITTRRFVESAFSGEGARLFGGRWNRPGQPLVYTAESRSLALLEMMEPTRYLFVVLIAFKFLLITRVEDTMELLDSCYQEIRSKFGVNNNK